MSEYHNPDAEKKIKNDAPTYTWSEVWTMVLTKPSMATFELILDDPEATRQRAFKWVFITGTIALIVQQIVNYFTLSSLYARYNYTMPANTLAVQLGCAVILGGVFVLIGFIIGNGITQAIAKLLGGVGTYSEFFYASASFGAPLIMVNVAISAFGGVGGIAVAATSMVLSFYQLALTVMALKAVNQFGTGKALLTIFMPFIVILGIIVVFVLLGTGAALLPQTPTRF